MDELYITCKHQSTLSDEAIIRILESFIHKKIIVAGSRLTREKVLEYSRRAQIYNFIKDNPAINFSGIVSHFSIGNHVGYMHLLMLQKFDFIRIRKYKIYNLYFPQTFPTAKEIQTFLLRNPNILKIYQCLKYHPLNPNALSNVTDLNYSTVRYHLDEMALQGLLIEKPNKGYVIDETQLEFLANYFNFTISKELRQKIEHYIKNLEK